MPIQTQQKTNSLIGQLMINGITVSPLKEIEVAGGNVLHILKKQINHLKILVKLISLLLIMVQLKLGKCITR